MALPLPSSLSPSKVSRFTECALAFKFNAIDRLPEPASPHALKGTLVHRALERLFWELPRGRRCAEAARGALDAAWAELLEDLRAGASKSRIAARFHAGVATAFIGAAKMARENTRIEKVAFSGGCLHNRRLARLLRTGLEEEGFQVFEHRTVSPGDGGLSYGQAAVAAAILATRP